MNIMKTQHQTSGYDRNQYGALIWTGGKAPATLTNGRKLLSRAIASGALPAEYISTDKKGRGDCLNYDVYDAARGAVLVQRRHTTLDKYGAHPQKDYFLIRSAGRGVDVSPVAHKSMIVKWSNHAKKLGDIIKADAGLVKIDTSPKTEVGYKAVTKNPAGHYVSVWDGSPWALGRERVEKASKDHSGGFYYYPSVAQCRAAALANDIFGEARSHQNLFIVRVLVNGARYQVFDAKHCASRLTPVALVEQTN